MQCACAILPSVSCPALQYFVNIIWFSEKKSLNTKCVFWFSLQRLSETFLILRRNERDVIKYIYCVNNIRGPGSSVGIATELLPLWTVQPVQSLSACTTVQFTFYPYLYSPYGPYSLYRASLRLQQCTLPYFTLLHINTKSVTAHNKRYKIPPPTSLHFAARVRRSRVVSLTWFSRLLTLAAACKMGASNSSGESSFILETSPYVQTHNQKSKRVGSVDSNSSMPATVRN